jgi:hypothetical protein
MNAQRRPGILSPAILLACLALVGLLGTAAGAEEHVVGKVTSVVGEATAQQPDGEARALAKRPRSSRMARRGPWRAAIRSTRAIASPPRSRT